MAARTGHSTHLTQRPIDVLDVREHLEAVNEIKRLVLKRKFTCVGFEDFQTAASRVLKHPVAEVDADRACRDGLDLL